MNQASNSSDACGGQMAEHMEEAEDFFDDTAIFRVRCIFHIFS
jgi:hypothetical protein